MVDVWPSKISSVSLLVLSVYRNGADAIPWRSATFTSDSYVESMPELVEKGLLDLPLERVIGVISDDRQVCRDARRQAMERVKELRAQSSSPSMEDARFNHVYETHDFRFHISELLIELTETLEKADGSGSRSGHFCELRREFDRLATLIQDLNKQKIDVPVQYLSVAEKLSEPATVQISRQLRFLALNWPGIAKFLKETKLYASERLTPSLRLSIKQTLKFFRDPEAKQQVQKAAINLAPLQSLIDTHIPNSSAMEAAAAISGVYDNLMGKELLHAEASLADISDRFRQCIGTYELAAMFVPVKRPSDLDSQNCAIKKALNIIGRSGSFGFTSSEVSSTIIHYFRHTGPFATVPTRCISADNYWSLFINDGEVSGDFSDGAKSLCHYLYAAATIPASMHPTDATLGADKRNWM
ncbi:hypothetical protein Pmar_PMAR019722 [Perkinsus marinus ATCC 50983]|uniref:Uncharacterized protein n=1 Tax=Perkinsus marinus (strain ATCC 50983 / TXsc) TaxID=423536 RepID=C5LW04_PERM5|nr:hypothetical protein Pmar_PMAR019722 [Perkinsus marinus ATCC 50983]EEQ99074.1 hypothetical protein Pmar_PMAR019722 [Perkinsus marinus ATCC 50983]|eukprot:XP_002766357.1 hypothetical protein Pmar_PMAR019722 [Perkinsus marinus ATCC 50983]